MAGCVVGPRAARLRRENARLRRERDLLKGATAFWVKEPGQ
jgi:transposase-like protein